MKTKSVPRDKWIEVYNSLILLAFFSHEYRNNFASIEEVNKRLNAFCSDNGIVGSNFHFEGGANALSFCYLIIVRTIEILNAAVGGDGNARKQFFKWTIETASKQDGLTSFDDITSKFDIDVQVFAYRDRCDEEKLYQLFRHIRHSISHFSYTIDPSRTEAKFKSADPRTKAVELDIAIPMHQVLNLTVAFGSWVNNTLHREDLLS